MQRKSKGPLFSYFCSAMWIVLAVELWEITCLPEYVFRPNIEKAFFCFACAFVPAVAVYDLVDGIIKQVKRGRKYD